MELKLDTPISDNFDELVHLAKHDPDAFESCRRQAIRDTIENAPSVRQTNLRRYQWRIDQETRRHGSSLGACIKLTQMMSQRMFSINRQLRMLSELSAVDTSTRQNFNKRWVKS